VTRSLGPELPETLLARLIRTPRGADLELAVVLATVDPFGWPHPALLSYAELSALDPLRLRLVLHDGSRSSRHLRDGGRATLVFADGQLTFYVKVEATPLPPSADGPGLARFELVVHDVLADRAEGEEAGATLTGGLTIAWPWGPAEGSERAIRLRRILLA
jgi:Pyridoxamine 5'-phosphate oxidase